MAALFFGVVAGKLLFLFPLVKQTLYEAVWLRDFLNELGIFNIILENGYLKTILLSTTIFANNYGVIKLIENPKYYCKTKYIFIKYHKIRELVKAEIVWFK